MTKVVFLSAVLLVLATALPYAVAFNPIFSTFSSLISDRKNTSLTSSRVNNKFNITVVTWNLAEKTPTRTQCLFLREFLDQDMIVIGVQECEDIRPRRKEGRRSVAWRKIQREYLGKLFKAVKVVRMGGLQLSIYLKKNSVLKVNELEIIEIPCGIGNLLSNKGAICAILRVNSMSLTFTNAHLAAHQDKVIFYCLDILLLVTNEMVAGRRVLERNKDYKRITNQVLSKAIQNWKHVPSSSNANMVERETLESSSMQSSRKTSPKKRKATLTKPVVENQSKRRRAAVPEEGGGQVSDSTANEPWPFHSNIFFGDLNYRLDLPRLEVDIFRAVYCRNSDTRPTTATSSSPIDYVFNNTIVPPAARGLLKRIRLSDQLGRVRLLGTAFKGFSEGPITFLPTFKYDSDSDEFDTSAKRRAPAWTDRILYKSVSSASLHRGNQTTAGAGESVLTLRRYGSLDVRHGDHRPVYGQFSLTLPPTTSRTTK